VNGAVEAEPCGHVVGGIGEIGWLDRCRCYVLGMRYWTASCGIMGVIVACFVVRLRVWVAGCGSITIKSCVGLEGNWWG